MSVVLETPNLVVRKLTLADLDFVATMLADPEVMRFWPKPYTRDEAEGWIDRQLDRYEQYGYGYWLALDKSSSEPVGQIGLLQQEVDGIGHPGLGYMIHRPFWHRGLALEDALATRRYAFENLGKPRVIALIRPGNIPSLRIALKLGMLPEQLVTYTGSEHLLLAVSRSDLNRIEQ
jgi:RimJ/RimL family protein N-acetyltransferase